MNHLALALLVGVVCCASACSGAERSHDCSRICDDYAACLDPDLDKTECVDKCEERGQGNAHFAIQASECEDCLDDDECGSPTLNCADKCVAVVGEAPLDPSDTPSGDGTTTEPNEGN